MYYHERESCEDAPILSICIPTYNRRELLKQILDELLQYPNNDIEIVIIDNASTDKTKELLDTYKDLRLRKKINKENIGMTNNQLKAMKSGRGKFTLTLMDRDYIDSSELIRITEHLYKIDSEVVLLDYRAEKETIVNGGIALSSLILRTHPSFLIYNTKMLHQKVNWKIIYQLIKKDPELPYAATGIIGFYLLSNKMNVSILPNNNAVVLEIQKVSSYTQYGIKNKIVYYEPEGSIRRYQKYVELLELEYPNHMYKKLLLYIYTSEFARGTLSNYYNSHSRYMRRKYKIRKRSFREYIQFYRDFFKQAVCLMIQNNNFSLTTIAYMNLVSWCFLYKIYCMEKPTRRYEWASKFSDEIIDRWMYTLA